MTDAITAKQISKRINEVLRTRLNLTTHMQYSGDVPVDDVTIPTAPKVGCQTKVADYTYLQPIFTNQSVDSYNLPIDGGMTKNDKLNVDTTKTGSRLITGILGKVRPHLPWVSKLFEGPGIAFPSYGTVPIPDPANPGQALAAPGPADRVVKGYRSDARPERFKRPRFYPGPGVTFDPQIPPFDQPTLVQTVNNGSTLGDTAQRRWGMTYTDGTHESEMGPLSDWALGYLQASVTVPAVPAGSAWSAITAIKLYRNTASDPETFKLAHSFGTGGGTITDTTADGSLGASYTPVNTAIKASGGSGQSANCTIDSNFTVTTRTPAYIPWNECVNGAAIYLDVAHTDGLTIPSDGGGDYLISTELQIDVHVTTPINWSLEYTLSIELWRSGTQEMYVERQDLYTNLAGTDSTIAWNDPTVSMTAVVPATQPGDVIKIGLEVAPSSNLLGPAMYVWGGFAGSAATPNPNGGWETWVSIAPVG